VYGLTGQPNAEGEHYVLREPQSRAERAAALAISPETLESRLVPLRSRLLAVREKRPAPLRDDKILCAWNGLMIAAYADGYRVLKDDRYRLSAEKAAAFLLDHLRTKEGRLLRTYREGRAKLPAYLEDYAFLAHGLLRLHRATGDARWVREARSLVDRMIADFEDKQDGGFFFTAGDHEQLLARAKDPFDNALPSGNSMAILDLLELYRITHETAYLDRAGKSLAAFATAISRVPAALPLVLLGLGQYLDERPETSAKELAAAETAGRSPDQIVTAKIVEGTGSPGERAPGAEFEVRIKLAINPGWHIYANPTGVAELNPTRLEVHPQSRNVVMMRTVVYPRGVQKILASSGKEKVALYEGEVEIVARCVLSADAEAGQASVKYLLSYQACNDQLCQAPARLEIPLGITVRRK
jgi:hypothetical protein